MRSCRHIRFPKAFTGARHELYKRGLLNNQAGFMDIRAGFCSSGFLLRDTLTPCPTPNLESHVISVTGAARGDGRRRWRDVHGQRFVAVLMDMRMARPWWQPGTAGGDTGQSGGEYDRDIVGFYGIAYNTVNESNRLLWTLFRNWFSQGCIKKTLDIDVDAWSVYPDLILMVRQEVLVRSVWRAELGSVPTVSGGAEKSHLSLHTN
ncbi:hypothetical protein EGW08_011515 [Elysia chlorotica]|uniref:Uncharacterized protein n=1 Tax=Elysia chlorotica TaxID=188477 RepID=A0A3S1BHB5_ELYCH|nr:hypothetical protein EGW08_011515 [Elysia chlorotica]